MEARENPGSLIVRRRTSEAEDLAAAERNLEGQMRETARREKIDGLKELSIGPDGRPRGQLNL
jgi:hypothetical protein